MIDLDELERLRLLAESEQCIDSHHVNDWLEYRVALSEAAPELIAMARRYKMLRRYL